MNIFREKQDKNTKKYESFSKTCECNKGVRISLITVLSKFKYDFRKTDMQLWERCPLCLSLWMVRFPLCAERERERVREKDRERRGRLRPKQAWNSACQKGLVLLSGQHHAHRSQSHPLPAHVPSAIGGPCRINSPIRRSHLPPGACIPGPADTIFEVKALGSLQKESSIPSDCLLLRRFGRWGHKGTVGKANKLWRPEKTHAHGATEQPWHCSARLVHWDAQLFFTLINSRVRTSEWCLHTSAASVNPHRLFRRLLSHKIPVQLMFCGSSIIATGVSEI